MPRTGASIAYRTEAAMPRAGAFMPIARSPPCLALRLPYCLSCRGRRALRWGILNPIARRLSCLALGLSLPIMRRLPCLALGLPFPITQGCRTSHRGFHIAYRTEASVPCRGFQIAYHAEAAVPRAGAFIMLLLITRRLPCLAPGRCLSCGGAEAIFLALGHS